MKDFAPVIRVIGILLLILAVMMIPLVLFDVIRHERGLPAIEWAMFTSIFLGSLCVVVGYKPGEFFLDRRQAFLLTTASWFVLPAVAAIPFLGAGMSMVDAYFEAASGFTTTGATVLTDLDTLPAALLFWRSFLQWIGGIGIIVMALFMLPFMRVAGMQLFRTESSDTSDKVLASSTDLIRTIGAIYLGMTIVCAIIYGLLGMTAFDAVNHAMTTVSTGGYSTHDSSFGYFQNMALQWVAIVFMVLAAIPFVIYVRALNLATLNFTSDAQVPLFLWMLGLTTLGVGLSLAYLDDMAIGEALTAAAFNIVSVVTTTGYATVDYTQWGNWAVGLFFLLTVVGGCSGSTSGGIKMYRFQILYLLIMSHLKGLVSPSRVTPINYNGRHIETDLIQSILSFLIIFMVLIALVAAALTMMGLDLLTALTAGATSVANVGPGLGPIIGPAGNFAPLPDAAKAILSFAMIAGRLEFFTLMVMLTKAFWVR
ncbi:TrkH family potassium uptake protein [Parvularcula sp. LCG005]|uniref:TrkH family potassium uptake protein n=1 Tax=Parvularcula sp. LCG005 TaxID=3078805 RepID=UPI002943ABD4|nr:TrkH family potassium uptake protein [Parvularcula sp. LCG005]WOI53835.1 TrkH family potassium uptake protein [Parvularcula sp. LCG005]